MKWEKGKTPTYGDDYETVIDEKECHWLVCNGGHDLVYLNAKVTKGESCEGFPEYWFVSCNGCFIGTVYGTLEKAKEFAVKHLKKYIDQIETMVKRFKEWESGVS